MCSSSAEKDRASRSHDGAVELAVHQTARAFEVNKPEKYDLAHLKKKSSAQILTGTMVWPHTIVESESNQRLW
jgi:hypothetical protein